MDIEVQLTIYTLNAWFEFKLCPINYNSSKETQECMDKHPLYLADNPRKTKFNVPRQGPGKTINYKVQLPPNVTCSQCVVQWTYRRGNINGGKGPQETFRNCADIEIKDTGTTEEKSCKAREKATNKLTQCEFPFKYKGTLHNGCIDYIDIREGKKIPGEPWCSTKVRGSDREHVTGGGHYGDCTSPCPGVDNGSSETQPALEIPVPL